MAIKAAVVMAVEKYKDKRIPTVQFAEADAKDFSAALIQQGFDPPNMMLSQDATKTTMESRIRREATRLGENDQLFVFYAGHGFSKTDFNYITCYDTDLSDLVGTSISLQWIFDRINEMKCKRVAVFLDSCESGMAKMPEVRGVYSSMSESELEGFFGHSEFRVCFSSCKVSENSYSTSHLNHGIWSYHLIESLRGEAPLALEKGRFLTAHSLQTYLSREVPRTLRRAFSDPHVQSPWFYGSHNHDFQIADMKAVLDQRSAVMPGREQVKQILFREIEHLSIKSLNGFVKGVHTLPRQHSFATRSFVEKISKHEVDEKIEATFEEIKAHMSYRFRDLDVRSGKIMTPDFEFSVDCSLDPDDLTSAVMTSEMTKINPKIVDDPGFNEVFDGCFRGLVFQFTTPVDVEKLIERLEAAEADTLSIDYPSDASWCEINLSGVNAAIRITADELRISHLHSKSPKDLVESFLDLQKKLSTTPAVKLLIPATTKESSAS